MRRKQAVVEALERSSNVLPAKEVRFVGWTQAFEKCRPNGKLCTCAGGNKSRILR